MFIVCAAILCALCVPVRAHQGNTDRNGGHTNQSTGEYHYHHGYPAHDHFDINGDGAKDCPYNFDEKKNYSSSLNEQFKNDSSVNGMEAEFVNPAIYIVFSILSISVLWLIISNILKKDRISALECENMSLKKENGELLKKYQSTIDNKEPTKGFCASPLFSRINDLENKVKDQMIELKKKDETIRSLDLDIKKRDGTIREIKLELEKKNSELDSLRNNNSKPDSAYPCMQVAFDGLPIYWKYNPKKPYGDYTVYLNKKAGIYHVDSLCAPFMAVETHIFKVIDHARPCKKCAEGFFDFTTVPDWFSG